MGISSGQALSYIIGCSSGTGLATAHLLAERGASVVIVARDARRVEAAKRELESGGGVVEAISTDLYVRDSVHGLIAVIERETRATQHLANAAGFFVPKAYLEYPAKDYDAYLDLNRALFFVTQAVTRNMAGNRSGSIVNIGSMWARQAIKATPSTAYSMAKAGLHSLTQTLDRVNAVFPAVVVTPLSGAFIKPDQNHGDHSRQRLVKRARRPVANTATSPSGSVPAGAAVTFWRPPVQVTLQPKPLIPREAVYRLPRIMRCRR